MLLKSKLRQPKAFTLVELLVASAVFLLLLAVIVSALTQTSTVWQSSTNKIAAFQSARSAFERLTRQISQATLNTYWEYDDPNNPGRYIRKSELHFLSGDDLIPTPTHAVFFQAPSGRTGNSLAHLGMAGLLNACGFFVDYVPDEVPAPIRSRIPDRSRYRLMQWVQNTEDFDVYSDPASAGWIQDARDDAVALADNVIALVIWPRLPDTEDPRPGWSPSYAYDSRAGATGTSQPISQHQLPPIVQVAMVAIDSRSADRLGTALQSTISSALSGLFMNLSSSDPESSLQDDLDELEQRLTDAGITYHVFESAIPLREAKWSE